MSARLLMRGRDGTVQSIDVGSGIQIGSAAANDVRLSESGISEVHARILVSDGGPWVEDAGGPGGTSVNGEAISTRRRLQHLDVITLASAVDVVFLQGEMAPVAAEGTIFVEAKASVPSLLLQVSLLGETPAPATTFDPGVAEGPPRELVMSAAGSVTPPDVDPDLTRLPPTGPIPPAPSREPQEFPIVGVRISGKEGSFDRPLGRFVVGRSSLASIRIKSTQMSREHAALVVTPATVIVEDQNSANGTLVNGTRINGTQRLIDGDVLTFAGLDFRVEVLRSGRVKR